MPIEQRSPPQDNNVEQAIRLAKVVSHLEPAYLGTLEVTLLKEQGNNVTDDTQTTYVKYAPPFYGVTGFSFQGANKEDINDTQKSYGMWMVPPDVGVTVLCVFVNGNIADGPPRSLSLSPSFFLSLFLYMFFLFLHNISLSLSFFHCLFYFLFLLTISVARLLLPSFLNNYRNISPSVFHRSTILFIQLSFHSVFISLS